MFTEVAQACLYPLQIAIPAVWGALFLVSLNLIVKGIRDAH